MMKSYVRAVAPEPVWKFAKNVSVLAKRAVLYDSRNWLRIKQIEAWKAFFAERAPLGTILEISPGGNDTWSRLPCAGYRTVSYPSFDISREALDEQFDFVIADQVLEHVAAPLDALRNIRKMVRPAGYAIIATPFLFRVHARPHDYSRWTESGLVNLLVEGGFQRDDIVSSAWGNKACARAHIGGPVRDYGWWRDLSNDPEYPLQVWCFAKK
ncbi:MAG TPA: methyltransferase domain-containing protein [Polyangiaceae bacterium]|jgi:SAM-dependent methyltransferase|nr:methyltransferase domain-containing protein [Polyangiaceae bacterium]